MRLSRPQVGGRRRHLPPQSQTLGTITNCILHFSDRPFFSQLDIYKCTCSDCLDGGERHRSSLICLTGGLIGDLMRRLTNEAALSPSRFAAGSSRYRCFQIRSTLLLSRLASSLCMICCSFRPTGQYCSPDITLCVKVFYAK